jgi:DNA mismatch repair protein MutL
LCFEMPAELVDVNVHPTKLEVRFQDGGRVYSQLLGTLRTRFLTTDLTHRLEPTAPDDPASAHDHARAAQLRHELVDWAKGQAAAWDQPPATAGATAHDDANPTRLQPTVQSTLGLSFANRAPSVPATAASPLRMERLPSLPGSNPLGNASDFPSATAAQEPSRDVPRARGESRTPIAALQIHNRYLVAESEEGVVVIDQHALHERILYEQLRSSVDHGVLEAQNLLVPEPIDLSAAEAAAVLEHQELLARLAIRVEPFGGETVLVSSYPAMLKGARPAEVLGELVVRLVDGRPLEARDLLDELLHMIACKAAVKAGDRLAPEEVEALVRERHLARDTHHCPHGRPTALVFTREDLDKQFKRT